MVILISYFIELDGFYYSMDFFAFLLKKLTTKMDSDITKPV